MSAAAPKAFSDALLCPRTGCGQLAIDCDDDRLFCACGNEWPCPEGVSSEAMMPEVLRLLAEARAGELVAKAALETVRHDRDVAHAGNRRKDWWLALAAGALERSAVEWERVVFAFGRTDDRRVWCREQATRCRAVVGYAEGGRPIQPAPLRWQDHSEISVGEASSAAPLGAHAEVVLGPVFGGAEDARLEVCAAPAEDRVEAYRYACTTVRAMAEALWPGAAAMLALPQD